MTTNEICNTGHAPTPVPIYAEMDIQTESNLLNDPNVAEN